MVATAPVQRPSEVGTSDLSPLTMLRELKKAMKLAKLLIARFSAVRHSRLGGNSPLLCLSLTA